LLHRPPNLRLPRQHLLRPPPALRRPRRRRRRRRSRRNSSQPAAGVPTLGSFVSPRSQASRMIVSMTGFGDATAQRGGPHAPVEIRSLNNRYFKPVIKLPETISGLEPEVESMLREKLGRGSITYILKTRSDSAEAAYHINTHALKSYLEKLQAVKGIDRLVQID